MELPVWHFVGIGSGLIIGIVSVLHVFVAQFAVGGGIYLVWMERRAYRDGAPEILQWLERHTHFFLLLTMVFGRHLVHHERGKPWGHVHADP